MIDKHTIGGDPSGHKAAATTHCLVRTHMPRLYIALMAAEKELVRSTMHSVAGATDHFTVLQLYKASTKMVQVCFSSYFVCPLFSMVTLF